MINNIVENTLSIIVYLLGGWDLELQALIISILLNYITCACKSGYEKKINETISIKGIIKSMGKLIIVAVSVVVGNILGNELIRKTVIYILISSELIAVLKNWSSMGIEYPKFLIEELKKLKG